MYKENLALNNLQLLISYETKPNQTKPYCFVLVTLTVNINGYVPFLINKVVRIVRLVIFLNVSGDGG